MDEEEIDGVKSPIKRLGSTRKLLVFNSESLSLSTSLLLFAVLFVTVLCVCEMRILIVSPLSLRFLS